MLRITSGYDAVGIAVASDTRDLQFESSHQQIYVLSSVINSIKRQGNGGIF